MSADKGGEVVLHTFDVEHVPNAYSLPATQADALAALDTAGQFATAIGWARAALVYALVGSREDAAKRTTATLNHGPVRKNLQTEGSGRISISDLAARRIHGLTSMYSIRKYRDAWESTGRPAVLGEPIDLDGLGELTIGDFEKRNKGRELGPKEPQADDGDTVGSTPSPSKPGDLKARFAAGIELLKKPDTGKITPITCSEVIDEMTGPSEHAAGMLADSIMRQWGSWGAFEKDRKAYAASQRKFYKETIPHIVAATNKNGEFDE